jgi:hypothetical protein
MLTSRRFRLALLVVVVALSACASPPMPSETVSSIATTTSALTQSTNPAPVVAGTPSSSLPKPLACSTSAEHITVQTGRVVSGTAVTLDFLLLKPVASTSKGVMVMFPGLDGLNMFSVCNNGQVTLGLSFLVRTAPYFVQDGFDVVVLGVPSDHLSGGIGPTYRASSIDLKDINALLAYLNAQGLHPIYLVGTSNGTLSVAYLATQYTHGEVSKFVLTSTVAHDSPYFTNPPSSGGFDLAKVNVPVLFIHNKDDGCSVSPYQEASQLPPKLTAGQEVTFVTVQGGEPLSEQDSDPCEPLTYHGYYGIENDVVNAITNWLEQ